MASKFMTLDDICLEVYLGEKVELDPFDDDEVNERLAKLVKTAREVNTGIWAKGWNREQALYGAGFEPDIIQTIANHEYAKDCGWNGC